MPHVLVAGKIHAAGLAILDEADNISYDVIEEVSLESYAPFIPKADALIIRTQPLTSAVIGTGSNLKIVSRHGVGYDAVDVNALNERKIPLTIVGDVNSRAVAEHTLMLMLASARRTIAHESAIKSRNWNERNRFDAVELDGKTLLLLGFGRIGRRVAQLAQAFGMNVLVFDPFLQGSQIQDTGCTALPNMEDGLPLADYLSLHLPASKKPIIGADQLRQMKSSAILINSARGELIDEVALNIALLEGRLRHAGLDVLSQEPPSVDNPLLDNPRVTLSPHNAGLTEECAARMGIASAQNVVNFFHGRLDPKLIVNFEALK